MFLGDFYYCKKSREYPRIPGSVIFNPEIPGCCRIGITGGPTCSFFYFAFMNQQQHSSGFQFVSNDELKVHQRSYTWQVEILRGSRNSGAVDVVYMCHQTWFTMFKKCTLETKKIDDWQNAFHFMTWAVSSNNRESLFEKIKFHKGNVLHIFYELQKKILKAKIVPEKFYTCKIWNRYSR